MNAAPSGRRRGSFAARLHRSGGSYTAGVVLAIALVVSVVGSLVTYATVHSAFVQHSAVDDTQTLVAKLFRLQLEEDTGLRGFLASGQRFYLDPYINAEPAFDATWNQMRDASARGGLHGGEVTLADLRHSHDRWIAEVANPLIARPSDPSAMSRMQLGKLLVDRMSKDFSDLITLYDEQALDASRRIQSLMLRAAVSTAALILLFGCAAIVADHYRSRTQAALERERVVADTLQRAFLSGWDAVPHLRVGTSYLSSTRDAAVGGDLFDIHAIDEHRCLVLVADVSGKGLEAAVETAQVKYSIRTLVVDESDPAVVLGKFNGMFSHSQRDPTAFVTAFVGILDDRDWMLRYASAGHAPVFVRRGDTVEQLPVTGPVVGVSESAEYTCVAVAVQPGDILVLATDGLTEARDSAGVLVDDDGVSRWIRDGDRDPQRLAAELVSKVTRFAGGGINDDLALLVIAVDRPQASGRTPGTISAGMAAMPTSNA